ncbi:F-box protein-like protein [Tanacetum coccineum]
MSSYVPVEIQINILKRLPVKSILRCTAVCKSLYSIIKNQDLLKPDFKLASSSILVMSFELRNDYQNRCLLLSQDGYDVRETFEFNCTSIDQFERLYNTGSWCNGVRCLSQYREGQLLCRRKLLLFNPCIRKLRPLPLSSLDDHIELMGRKSDRYVGFGYDKVDDDYKVIKLYRICKGLRSDSIVHESETWMFDVDLEAEVYNDGLGRASIIAFNFSAEVFREVMLPIECCCRRLFLFLYKGSLALLEIIKVLEDDFSDELDGDVEDVLEEALAEEERNEEMQTVTLWILKVYGEKESWSMEFTRKTHISFDFPINFTENGKLILQIYNNQHVAWDPETDQVVNLVSIPTD